jgi:hypothetical protein
MFSSNIESDDQPNIIYKTYKYEAPTANGGHAAKKKSNQGI